MGKLYSIPEISRNMGLGKDRIYKIIKENEDCPVLKVGSQTKIDLELFQEWLEKCIFEGRRL
jgi:excisionase family DNA binding protein